MGSEAADKRLERWDETLDRVTRAWLSRPEAQHPFIGPSWKAAVKLAGRPALRQEEPGGKRSV